MSYPKPNSSEAYGAHEYCRDAVCKKILGVIPKKPVKELEFNKPFDSIRMIAQPKYSMDSVLSIFGGNKMTTFVAKGSYGAVFKMTSSNALKNYLKKVVIPKSKTVIGSVDKIPPGNERLALKLQVISDDDQLKAVQVENSIHKRLSRSSITNSFYVGGLVGNIFWQLSSFIDGKSLCSATITAEIFEKIEKAVYKLWSRGIFHADLHCNNMMLTKDGKIMIIDFGRAIILPESLSPNSFKKFKSKSFQEKVQSYTNRVVIKRANTQQNNYVRAKVTAKGKVVPTVTYSDDVQSLRVFYNRLSAAEKAKLK